MTLDEQLIKKAYYKIFINEQEETHPIRTLGELFQLEHKKDLPDLSYIRFAQGEVYFLHCDFEAAIFKWENIVNELEPWAKKNMADAYCELGLLPTAENIYECISTDNLTLSTEVALKLFSVYIEFGKLDSAVKLIKNTVAANPDYPYVTESARSFFEEQHDWGNAIELAINEGIRTESLPWFDVLKTYIDQGLTKGLEPKYFTNAITLLAKLDQSRCEEMVTSLWNSYKQEVSYFSWLKEINKLLFGLEFDQKKSWHQLSKCFKETYFALIDGQHLISQLQDIVPNLLVNWLRVADTAQAVFASTAALSWSELFPLSIPPASIQDAELLFSRTVKNVNEFKECQHLFDLIIDWAKTHDMGDNHRLKWMADQLANFDLHYVYIAGMTESGKTSFTNFVLGEKILRDTKTSSVVLFKGNDQLKITEISDSEVTDLASLSDFQERMERRRNALESIIVHKQPFPLLLENKIALFHTPSLNENHFDNNEVVKYLTISDAVLFVLGSSTPFADKEREIISYIQNEAPEIPIHFVLYKAGNSNEEEAIQKMKAVIHSYLPEAKVFAFSSQSDHKQQLKDLGDFINTLKAPRNMEDKRMAKLLSFIRETITMLLKKRIDVENQLIESVRWNEDIVSKLSGAQNQLSDLEGEKINVLTRSYRSIKETMKKEMLESIPKLLQECSQFIKEDSNFSRIHLELNEEMNRRLQEYMNTSVLPKYFYLLQEWIEKSKEEFEQGQVFLEEMASGFNTLYGEERMILNCDLKILDDWRRDKDRMTSSFKLEPVNILLRRTPSQLLIKSAGKFFGAIGQNKTVLFKRYVNFIEMEDYSEPALMVSKQFFQQFELFEKSLDRDIILLFKHPASVLHQFADEARQEILANKGALKKMNTNPELFRDPLTLFELRLRQYEWMTVSRETSYVTY